LSRRAASLLQAGDLLGQVALDRYTFVREAYLARRRSLVYDGNPPEETRGRAAPATPALAANRPRPWCVRGRQPTRCGGRDPRNR
jgi:phospholipid-binding lipoprotein MlaA